LRLAMKLSRSAAGATACEIALLLAGKSTMGDLRAPSEPVSW
jgi:hypothetical protein